MTFRNKVLPGGTNTSADRVYIRTFLPELSRTIKNDIYCAQTHTEIIASLPISCNDNVPYTVTRAQRHTDRILKSAHLTLKLRVSFHSESE